MKQMIHFLVKHKFLGLFILCGILLISQKNYAQEFGNQGEGHVMIKTYMSFQPFTPINNKEPSVNYDFYIKEYQVLRAPFEKEEVHDPPETVTMHRGYNEADAAEDVQIKFSFTAKVVQPKYIINLKKSEVSVIKNKKDSVLFYREDLKENKEDFFYRYFYHKENKNTIQYQEDSTRLIAGRLCKKGWFYLNRTEENGNSNKKVRFWYSKETSQLISPLNHLFKSDFPFQVFAVSLPIDTVKKGYLNFMVDLFEEEPVKVEKFDLPKKKMEVDRKTWQEMWH
ncbi:hypothetical protein SAMN04487907_10713 [Zunongwangia mangrovi]|uniref:Uncharacterized protein n=2 Tax=Zunongwangia mangrovi TaxID=1334022 RepID=A0A1I1L1Y5_9FLAO|nr:hypothetical protein SAMN04487907_10713 [Zunongwangia mangrovi]